jgi:hypothetical protein
MMVRVMATTPCDCFQKSELIAREENAKMRVNHTYYESLRNRFVYTCIIKSMCVFVIYHQVVYFHCTALAPAHPRLQVNVAQRPLSRAHQVVHLDRWSSSVPKVNNGVKRGVSGRNLVEESASAGDALGALARLLVQLLPHPPGAIDHPVVQVEDWVSGRDEEIASWVTADGVVTWEFLLARNEGIYVMEKTHHHRAHRSRPSREHPASPSGSSRYLSASGSDQQPGVR